MAAPTPETARALASSARDFAAADEQLRSLVKVTGGGHGPGELDAVYQQRATAYVIARRAHADHIEKAELEIREAMIDAEAARR